MTILLRVLVNGEEFVIAGEPSLSVLSTHVTAVGRLGPESKGTRHMRDGGADIDISVGGLTSRADPRQDEHLRWGQRLALKPGDSVTIEVLEGEPAQAPTSRSPARGSGGAGGGRAAARLRWQKAKSLYLSLRRQFGARADQDEARTRREAIRNLRLGRW